MISDCFDLSFYLKMLVKMAITLSEICKSYLEHYLEWKRPVNGSTSMFLRTHLLSNFLELLHQVVKIERLETK